MAEEIRKSKLLANKKYQKYFCSLCRIYTNSEHQLNQHLEGIRHQQRKLLPRQTNTDNLDKICECDSLVYILAFINIIITSFIFCYTVVAYTH
ncbi:unnamed protein product [Chrysodeixis includens]|uniref:C2H2-type domain-containing protein n=1 Tax=Chrysodeixis includens TaxID=689277 RepID=A0A9N8Q1U9_CHRIL|nr:unnamed protein product [Chrysodeixis includens]